MGRFKTIAASIAITLCIFSLGCGIAGTPQIQQIFPQAIPVGTQAQTIKIMGANFSSKAAALWNGSKLTTSMVDVNTITATVPGSSLSTPGAAKVVVQDTENQQESLPQVVVVQPAALAIGTSSLPSGTAGTAYNTTLTASGGNPGYTWSVASGSTLPAGLSLGSSTGVISGTPATGGNYSFGVIVTDTTSATQSAMLTLAVAATGTSAAAASTTFLRITSSSLAAGTVGSANYSSTLQAMGGTAPYTWSLSGLPKGSGLRFSTSGVLSGTPGVSGTFQITETVTDSSSPAQTKSAQTSLIISPSSTRLTITTSSLAAGTVGVGYSATLQATGGVSPYTWTANDPPAGLSLASSGEITGTPTAGGTSHFTVTVVDSGNQKRTARISILVNSDPLTITTSSLAAGTVGAGYSATLQATGGVSPYTWAANHLPAGLSLASNGAITGTPTAGGTSRFTATVMDRNNEKRSAKFSISVATASTPLKITSSSLATGTVGIANYSSVLQASGGTAPYTWTLSGLPNGSGLSFSSAGVLSGTPAISGTFPVTAAVTDSSSPAQSKSVQASLVISPAGLTIRTTSVATGTVGTGYSAMLQAAGGTSPYKWTASGLPAGLSLASGGAITGTPTAGGTSSFTATVTDSGSQTRSAKVSIAIGSAALAITSSSLATGTVGIVNYSSTLQATGGSAPYTWALSGLPNGSGLSFSTSGVLSGTPAISGTFPVTATVTDSSSPAKSKSVQASLVISPAGLAIKTTSVVAGTVGTGYSATLQAAGGTSPYKWTASGLPAGLSLASGGAITGTPTASGTSSFTATVTDSSNQTRSAKVSIAIGSTALAITSSSLAAGTVGAANYSSTLQATGGTAPYTWALSGLPNGSGLSFSTSGILSGTPAVSGTFPVTATVTDSSSSAQTKSVQTSLVISPAALTITTSALSAGTVGTGYSSKLQASGGTPGYTWALASNSTLPAGLSLTSSTGAITGTPTASGSFPVTATVTDSSNPAQAKSITTSIKISAPALAITTSSLAAGTTGTSYSKTLQASGGTGPYVWTATGLPAGLSVSAAGVLAGTPTASGNFSVVLTAKDAESTPVTATATLTLAVAAQTSQLSISAVNLPVAAQNQSYTGSFTATGGTAPYTWSVTVGSLPTGLSLSPAGAVSGTPTTLGKVSFTATVTDSSSTPLTNSTATFITVAAAPLAITSTSLAAATDGTNYSAPVQVTGGTPAYTWSISAGALPAGLTISPSTGIISGTPTAAGTASFTVNVADNSATPQAQSAKLTLTVNAAASVPAGPGTTWYIRPDGGTRYSANATQGQCDGQADTAYPGSGTNQHCAFNDYRFLWDDQHTYGSTAWVISGGDTIVLRGGPWRVGFDQGQSPNDVWCQGGGGNGSCVNPTIPSGTADQHTKILGENYASCGATNKTQIFGGYGLWEAINLSGAKYVDIECLDITRHSQCVVHGNNPYPSSCSTDYPVDDYDSEGITTDVNTSNILLQDLWIHGHTDRGIKGAIGGPVTCLRCDIAFNGEAGWDFDDGTGSNNGNGTASLSTAVWNFTNSIIEWSGCNQQYPAVDPIPAISCYAQNTGGYGDGVGSPPGGCLTTNINGSTFRYNMQDGLDLGHYDTSECPLTIKNSTAYGNLGGTFKWGAAESPAIFENNVAIANGFRLSQPLTGLPSSVTAMLAADPGDMCRAGDAVSFNLEADGVVVMSNNTVVNYCNTSFDVGCWASTNCSASSITFQNNLVLGFDNPVTYDQGGQSGGPGAIYYQAPIGNVVRTNNLWYGVRNTTCPTGYPGEICLSPQLVNQPTGTGGNFVESELDNFDPHPGPGSPAIGAGVVYTGIPSTDYSGATRPNPPSIGAVEP